MTTHPHGPTVRTYLLIFATLLALTAATVSAAEVDLGAMNNVVMLGIAVTKATLVVLFFMHVWYGPRLNLTLALGGVAWLALLIGFTLSDVLTRAPSLGAVPVR
jgi:cytochrome c oxidase subunit 4